jgi:hypothetical protein
MGFVSLTVLILAYLKSWWKALVYIGYFLLIGTLQLIFLSYLEYLFINTPMGYNTYYAVLNYSLECFTIIMFPLLINELFNVTKRRQINYIFGALFFSGLVCIAIPVLSGVSNNGIRIES